MRHEATVELLSRFLDGDVSATERRQVDDWLESDTEVRAIYEGLSRVRGSLAGLADAAPPAHLGVMVQRRVALEAEQAGVWRHVDRSLRRWLLEPAMLPAFAVVLAMAAMFYLLANGLARFERPREPVFLSAPPGSVTAPESVSLAGRTLILRGERWVESGLDEAALESARRIEVSTAERQAWIVDHPQLAPAVELGRVLMRLDGEVVELVFAAGDG